MDRSAVIYLITETWAKDDLGVMRSTQTRRKTFANVTSVTASEWFEGGRNGLNPELRFRMFGPEYHNEEILEYKGNKYTIYRTFVARDDLIELYTERRKGNE